jgi:hypothetical protein
VIGVWRCHGISEITSLDRAVAAHGDLR